MDVVFFSFCRSLVRSRDVVLFFAPVKSDAPVADNGSTQWAKGKLFGLAGHGGSSSKSRLNVFHCSAGAPPLLLALPLFFLHLHLL